MNLEYHLAAHKWPASTKKTCFQFKFNKLIKKTSLLIKIIAILIW